MAGREPDLDHLQLEVITLAQELAMEALANNLTKGRGIYHCFTAYLKNKLDDRQASERAFAKAAWSEETRFIKELHQSASLQDFPIHSRMSSPRSVASAPSHAQFHNTKDEDVRLSIDDDSDPGNYSDSSVSLSLSSESHIESPLSYIPNEEESRKNPQLHNHESLESTEDDSGVCDAVVTNINEIFKPQAKLKRAARLVKERQQSSPDPASQAAQHHHDGQHDKEEDLCTFVFFSSTVEDISKPKTEILDNRLPKRRNSIVSMTSDSGSSCSENDLLIMTLEGHKSTVTHCCVMDKLILTSSRDGTLKIWILKTGKLLRTLNCKRPVHQFRILQKEDCFYIIIGCEDGALVLMKVTMVIQDGGSEVDVNVKLGGEYSGHLPNPIRAMALSPNGSHLATGCCFLMNQIKLNRMPQLTCRGTLKTWNLAEMVVASEEGKFYDGAPMQMKTMRQFVASSKILRKTNYHKRGRNKADQMEEETHGIRAITYSPDGSMLVIGFGQPEDLAVVDSQMLVVVSAGTLETLWSEGSHLCQVNGVHFLPPLKPDDAFRMVVSTQTSMHLAVLHEEDSSTATVEDQWKESVSEYLMSSTVSPGGDMATSCYKYSLRFRSTHNGEEVYRIRMAHSMPTSSVCFSPGGDIVCSGSMDGSVRLWHTPRPPKTHRLDLLSRKRTTAPSASGSRTSSR